MSDILCTGLDKPGLYKPQNPCRASHGGPCDACLKIKEVESQISSARQISLEKLLEQHRELRTEMNLNHNPIILQAPPEIASAIFEFCFPPLISTWDSEFFSLGYRRRVADRLLLGAVCRGWRRIAWSTPGLWTALAIRFNSRLSYQPLLIQEWIDRSGALPLTVSAYSQSYKSSEDFKSDSYPNAMALFNILNRCSDRWQTFELDDIPAALYSSFCGNSSSTSTLRSLAVRSKYTEDGKGEFSIQGVIPRPDKVMLYGPRFNSVAIAWDNVTCVDVRRLQVHEYFELLRQAPNLRKLTLDVLPTERDIAPVPIDKIIHHQLEELDIDNYDTTHLKIFLEEVVFPGLVRLTVSDDEETLDFGKLLSLLQRSACRLRELDINGSYYGSSEIVAFLEHIPSLEELDLSPPSDSNHFPDELFKRLTETSIGAESEIDVDATAFLPHLRSFRYNAKQRYCAWASNRKFPWGLLSRIFGPLSELGNPRRRPLHAIEITFCRDEDPPLAIDMEYIPPLLSILKAGLELKIHYLHEDLDLMDPIYDLWDAESGSDSE